MTVETIDSIESICIVPDPENAYDQLWMVVNRANGRFVEYLTNRLQAVDCGDERESLLEGQVFLDSALSYDNPLSIESIDSVGSSTLVSTETAHGFSSGDIVVLSCAGDFDGRFEVEAITSPCDDAVAIAYEFEGSEGTNFTDLSCFAHVESIFNGAPEIDYTTSKFGNGSMYFPRSGLGSGSNEGIEIPGNNCFLFNQPKTLEFFVYYASVNHSTEYVTFFQYGTGPNVPFSTGYAFTSSNGTSAGTVKFLYWVKPAASGGEQITADNVSVSTGVWHHVEVDLSGVNGNSVEIYFNGTLVGSGTIAGVTPTMAAGAQNMLILSTLTGVRLDSYIIRSTTMHTENFTPRTTPYSPVAATTSFRILDAVLGTPIDSSTYTAFSGTGYARLAADTFEGLEHLESETVGILADGVPQEQQVVTDGSIVLSSEFGQVTVGLPYYSDVALLPLEQI